jgi:hypothetical protein
MAIHEATDLEGHEMWNSQMDDAIPDGVRSKATKSEAFLGGEFASCIPLGMVLQTSDSIKTRAAQNYRGHLLFNSFSLPNSSLTGVFNSPPCMQQT